MRRAALTLLRTHRCTVTESLTPAVSVLELSTSLAVSYGIIWSLHRSLLSPMQGTMFGGLLGDRE